MVEVTFSSLLSLLYIQVLPLEWTQQLNTKDIEKLITGFCKVHDMEISRRLEETLSQNTNVNDDTVQNVDSRENQTHVDTNTQMNDNVRGNEAVADDIENKPLPVTVISKSRCCVLS